MFPGVSKISLDYNLRGYSSTKKNLFALCCLEIRKNTPLSDNKKEKQTLIQVILIVASLVLGYILEIGEYSVLR